MNSTQTVLVDLEKKNTNHSDPIEVESHRFSNLKAEAESETSVITTYTPPDGGMKAWRTVAGVCCLAFAAFGPCDAFGVYQDYYARVYLTNYTPSQIGWIGSTQLCLIFFLSLPAGLLFDAGYFYWMMRLASVCYCVAFFGLSFANPQAFGVIFVTHGIVVGASIAFLFLPPIAILSHHFKERRPLALGIVTAATACGSTLFPWLLNYLIQAKGFAIATRIVTGICFGMLALANFLMRTQECYSKQDIQKLRKKMINIRSFFKEPEYVLFLFSAFFSGLGLYFVGVYIQLFAVQHNIAPGLVLYIVTMVQGSSFFGRLSFTFMGKICGTFNINSVSTILLSIFIFILLGINDSRGIIAIAILFGLVYGIFVPSSLNSLMAFAKSGDEVGTRMGISFFSFALGVLGFSPISGALLGRDYHWSKAICFHGVCLMLSGILVVIVRIIMAKRRGIWNV